MLLGTQPAKNGSWRSPQPCGFADTLHLRGFGPNSNLDHSTRLRLGGAESHVEMDASHRRPLVVIPTGVEARLRHLLPNKWAAARFRVTRTAREYTAAPTVSSTQRCLEAAYFRVCGACFLFSSCLERAGWRHHAPAFVLAFVDESNRLRPEFIWVGIYTHGSFVWPGAARPLHAATLTIEI
jgi:hypothetical protein